MRQEVDKKINDYFLNKMQHEMQHEIIKLSPLFCIQGQQLISGQWWRQRCRDRVRHSQISESGECANQFLRIMIAEYIRPLIGVLQM